MKTIFTEILLMVHFASSSCGSKIKRFFSLLLALVFIMGCQTSEMHNKMLKNKSLNKDFRIASPSKVFLLNASVVIMPYGFRVENGSLIGFGHGFDLNGKAYNQSTYQEPLIELRIGNDEPIIGELISEDSLHTIILTSTSKVQIDNDQITSKRILDQVKIKVDSIAAVTYYEKIENDKMGLAYVMNGILSFAYTGTAIYCLACPKCCFGSCPTVYVLENNGYELKAELYSHSIARMLKDDDIDLIGSNLSPDGNLKLLVTNEALETHYIDRFELLDVNHPEGTEVYPSGKNGIIAIRRLDQPIEAFNLNNVNIKDIIENSDGRFYRSGDKMVNQLFSGYFKDELVLRFRKPSFSHKGKLVIRYRNTLLSTILFYDMVLGSQGIKAIDWLDKMNNNPFYAAQFKLMYNSFSGIDVSCNEGTSWKKIGIIGDAGPINWKSAAFEIPLKEGDDYAEIKISFFPDNFMIDFVGLDASGENINMEICTVEPSVVKNSINVSDENVKSMLKVSDGKYLITQPGEKYELNYNINSLTGSKHTILVSSTGYYTEWIRGKWIAGNESDYEFDLYDISRNVNELAHRWLTDRTMLEEEFFKTRIPIKGGLK